MNENQQPEFFESALKQLQEIIKEKDAEIENLRTTLHNALITYDRLKKQVKKLRKRIK